MKELIEYIAKNLVSNPDEVKITEELKEDDPDHIIFKLEVATEDKGKIIGRHGRVAQAIRILLRITAVKNGSHASLKII